MNQQKLQKLVDEHIQEEFSDPEMPFKYRRLVKHLEFIEETIKNINTDEEVEEIEKRLDKLRGALRRMDNGSDDLDSITDREKDKNGFLGGNYWTTPKHPNSGHTFYNTGTGNVIKTNKQTIDATFTIGETETDNIGTGTKLSNGARVIKSCEKDNEYIVSL